MTALDALGVGQANVSIGAGRQLIGENLRLGSGVLLHKKVGDALREGDVLFTLFAEVGAAADGKRAIGADDINDAAARIFAAYTWGDAPPAAEQLIRCFIDRKGNVVPEPH